MSARRGGRDMTNDRATPVLPGADGEAKGLAKTHRPARSMAEAKHVEPRPSERRRLLPKGREPYTAATVSGQVCIAEHHPGRTSCGHEPNPFIRSRNGTIVLGVRRIGERTIGCGGAP
jgi:hypothetical protein